MLKTGTHECRVADRRFSRAAGMQMIFIRRLSIFHNRSVPSGTALVLQSGVVSLRYRLEYRTLLRHALPVLFVCAFTNLYAQPSVKITDLFPNWPTISLRFSVRCDGRWKYDFSSANMKLFENGKEISTFSLWCPDTSNLCPLSAVLVLDASESMTGVKNERTKTAAKYFIGLMDGADDEAALFWFNQAVTLRVPLTKDKAALIAGVDELPSTEMTAAWDAAYAAIAHIASLSEVPAQCRAVILLTDGRDNSSSQSLQSVIAYAITQQVRVFTIGIGEDVNDVALNMLANQTGGQYFFSDDAYNLNDIFERVFIESRSLYQCELYYAASCPDGTQRDVELRLTDYCNGASSDIRIYAAPLDSSAFTQFNIDLGGVNAGEQALVQLPLFASQFPADTYVPAGSMILAFDSSCITFVDPGPQGGTLLQNASVTWTKVPEGVKLSWNESMPPQQTDYFATLFFRTHQSDSIQCCDIAVQNFGFVNGCLYPKITNGFICSISEPPELQCSLLPMDTLRWSDADDAYVPDTAAVAYIVTNTGTKAAKNARYTLQFDASVFTLVDPHTANQTGGTLEPGARDTVRWTVRVRPQGDWRTLPFCITAHFDNAPDLQCCNPIVVEPTPRHIACSIDAPLITADDSLQRYVPMPFPVTVIVTNAGFEQKDSVRAILKLIGNLQIADGDSPEKLVALHLPGKKSVTAVWMCTHPVSMTGGTIPIEIIVVTANGDTTRCSQDIVLPPLAAPLLKATCSVPASLELDPFNNSYIPSPFQVALKIANIGLKEARTVSALIQLPEGVKLAAGESYRKSAAGPLTPTGETEFTWLLEYTQKLAFDRQLPFRWTVGGSTSDGIPLDSVYSRCFMFVPALPPSFQCKVTAPDSLIFNETTGLLLPNPVPLSVRVRNISLLPRSLAVAQISTLRPDISFHPLTPPQQAISKRLQPGEFVDVLWYAEIPIAAQESYAQFYVRIQDSNNVEIECNHELFIPGSIYKLLCSVETSAPGFFFSSSTGAYQPGFIDVSAEAVNVAEEDLLNTRVRLTLAGQSGYLSLDPSIPGNTLERTIPIWKAGDRTRVSWRFVQDSANSTASIQKAVTALEYFDPTKGWLPGGCSAGIQIGPVDAASSGMRCSIAAPDTIRFDDSVYVPEIFEVYVSVSNAEHTPMEHVSVTLLQDTRFTSIGSSNSLILSIDARSTETIDPPFRLRIKPSPEDRYDTLRVLSVSESGDYSLCEKPVFIQKTKAPEIFIECIAIPDTVHYNQVSSLLEPDTVVVAALAANTGDAIAKDVVAVLVTPPGYQLIDSALVRLARLLPGHSAQIEWRLKPFCETAFSLDTIRTQFRARGGYQNPLVIGECGAVLFKDACEPLSASIACSMPDSIVFTSQDGGYRPVPALLRSVVRNTGSHAVENAVVRIQSTTDITLAAGMPMVVPVQYLAPGDSVELEWEVLPVDSGIPSTGEVCLAYVWNEITLAECCSRTEIVPFTGMKLSVDCTSIDTLIPKADKSGYINSPFTLCASISNAGMYDVDSIRATLEAPPGFEILGSADVLFPSAIRPGEAYPSYCWTIIARPSLISTLAEIKVVVRTPDSAVFSCRRIIYVPSLGDAAYGCSLYFDSGDTIVSDREGTPATVRAVVRKNTPALWDDLTVSLMLPPAFDFASGETPLRTIIGQQASADSVVLLWSLILKPKFRASEEVVRSIIARDTTILSLCTASARIDGIDPVSVIRIPSDLFAEFGRPFAIPLYVEDADPVNVTRFTVRIEFDPALVSILGASTSGTITEAGWNIESSVMDNGGTQYVVSARSTGSGSILQEGKPLFILNAFAADDRRKYSPVFLTSALSPVDSAFALNRPVSTMSALIDGVTEDVAVRGLDGMVYITGNCILPLERTSPGVPQLQASPNPFNPVVRIQVSLPREMFASLAVFDMFGRKVADLFSEVRRGGVYSVEFDAGSLAGGVYYARLSTDDGAVTLKLILDK